MKEAILRGKIKPLLPKKGGGGLSMEVHILEYLGKKYVLRICETEKKAKFYEWLSNKLKRYNILPKFIYRHKNKVLFEYLSGRDLRETESKDIFKKVGKICAIINKISKSYNKEVSTNIGRQIKELVSGKYNGSSKINEIKKRDKRHKERFDKRRIKAVLKEEEGEKLLKIADYLLYKLKPKFCLDANDVTGANFRLSNGEVYLVDIEAIKIRVKGFGIGKCFLKWAKTPIKRKAFLEGYKRVLSTNFLTEEYLDFLYLNFLAQTINYKAQIGRDYKNDSKKFKRLIMKYSFLF